MKRKFTMFSFWAAVLVLMLVACAAPVTLTVPSAPTATGVVEQGRPTAGQAQKGGSLTVGIIEEPEILNPYITQLATSFNVLSGIMDSLLSFDTEQQLQPALAESYSVSDDGLVYTFKLRKDVKWHDGTPFGAQDVVATWKIIMNPDFGAFQTLGWDKVVDIGTPDNYTAVMTTSEKYAPFLAYVGSTIIGPKHLIDKGIDSFKQEFGRNPIGTGPFKFQQWQSGQSIQLVKNPDYWGGVPKLDKITVKIVPDTNTLLVQLKTGEVQLTDAIGVPEYTEAQALPNSAVISRDGQNWEHIDLKNLDHLMDRRVRQALDYATPKQQIVEKLFLGLATVAVGDQSPGTPYYNHSIQPRPYDPEKAALLLKEAGFAKGSDGIMEKEGKPLKIEYWIVSGDQQTKRVQQVIAASWRKLGIDVDEREEAITSIFGPNGYQFTKAMTAGQYAWLNVNDPDDMFYWHSSQIPQDPTGSGGNLPAYFNKYEFQEEIDELSEAGTKEMNPEKRKVIYFKIQEILHEYVPVIFLYWDKRIYVAPKNLAGFSPNPYNALLWNVKDWGVTE